VASNIVCWLTDTSLQTLWCWCAVLLLQTLAFNGYIAWDVLWKVAWLQIWTIFWEFCGLKQRLLTDSYVASDIGYWLTGVRLQTQATNRCQASNMGCWRTVLWTWAVKWQSYNFKHRLLMNSFMDTGGWLTCSFKHRLLLTVVLFQTCAADWQLHGLKYRLWADNCKPLRRNASKGDRLHIPFNELATKVKSEMESPEWHASVFDMHLRKLLWMYCLGHDGVKGNDRSTGAQNNHHKKWLDYVSAGLKCWWATQRH